MFQLLLFEDREDAKRRNTLTCKDESVRHDEEPVSPDESSSVSGVSCQFQMNVFMSSSVLGALQAAAAHRV